MATEYSNYVDTKPGLEQAGQATTKLHISPSEGQFAFHGANSMSAAVEKRTLLAIGGRFPYVAARYTETKDNSSTIAYAAGGLRLQTQATPTDNDDTVISSIEAVTLAAGKIYTATVRIQVSSAANLGFQFGFVTAGSTELYTADPADGVYFHKAKNSANVVGRVRENSNTATDSATLLTMTDAADAILTLRFCAGTSAATSWGEFVVNGTRTAFTSAQVTDLFDMVNTTAPSLQAHLAVRVNSTTQRNALVQYALAECDR